MANQIAVVFDFDWSFVNENTDTYVVQTLCPHLAQLQRERHWHDKSGVRRNWTEMMDEVIGVMMRESEVSEEQMRNCVANIPVYLENLELVRELKAKRIPALILSDSNDFFIHSVLHRHDISDCFDCIVTNPTTWQDVPSTSVRAEARGGDGDEDADHEDSCGVSGVAAHSQSCRVCRVAPYHGRSSVDVDSEACSSVFNAPVGVNDGKGGQRAPPISNLDPSPPHKCSRCPPNLCKGSVMDVWRAEGLLPPRVAPTTEAVASGGGTSDCCGGLHHGRVIYVGDGAGDLCPVLNLGPSDVVCVRRSYPLHRELIRRAETTTAEGAHQQQRGHRSDNDGSSGTAAHIRLWSDGEELCAHIRDALGWAARNER